MNSRTLSWTLAITGFVFNETGTPSFSAPVYEPIAAVTPTPTFSGQSLFRHSDGTLYGVSSSFLYRINAAGEVTTFPPAERLGFSWVEARDLSEASDGTLWAVVKDKLFRFDPEQGKTKIVAASLDLHHPARRLASDRLGYLWGVANRGGPNARGGIYKVDERSGEVTVVHLFTGVQNPTSGLPQSFLLHNGLLWSSNFTRSKRDAVFLVVDPVNDAYHEFGFASDDLRLRRAGPLSDDREGNLWCATEDGAVVKVDPQSKKYTVVAELPMFAPQTGPAHRIPHALVPDGTGNVWGALDRSAGNASVIFKVNIATGTLSIVAEFEGYDSIALGELIPDGLGWFWIVSGNGTVRKINIATGEVRTVRASGEDNVFVLGSFLAPDEAYQFHATFLQRADDDSPTRGGVFRIDARTGAFTILAEFSGAALTPYDGLAPGAALVSGKDGNLWGVAPQRRPTDLGPKHHGFIYKVDPISWTMTRVIEFTGEGGSNPGTYPIGLLTAGPDGYLWGAAWQITTGPPWLGPFVFKVDPMMGTLVRVAELPFGHSVPSSLVDDGVGNFWASLESNNLIRINAASGEVTVITPSKYMPTEQMVSTGDGYLWSLRPGSHPSSVMGGGISRLDTRTSEVTDVHEFRGGVMYPHGLCSDGQGRLWGTVGVGPGGGLAIHDDPQPGSGAIFKLNTKTARVTYLHNIPGLLHRRQGVISSRLVFERGAFYGTTLDGGSRGYGTIFSVNRQSFNTLFEFTKLNRPIPGAYPAAAPVNPNVNRSWRTPSGGLVRHTDGNLYGSTSEGGILPDGRPAGAGQFYRVRFGATPTTLAAVNTSASASTVRGTINPNGAATTASFEYGLDPELKTFWMISAGELPDRSKAKPVSVQLTELEPSTTYYFRVVGRNAENAAPQRGAIFSFTTTAAD